MKKYTVVLVLVLLCLIENSSATCFECLGNGVACISKNEFSPCFENKIDNTTKFSCTDPGAVCTETPSVCINKEGITPTCGDLSMCGKCDTVEDGGYACTSRTTYVMCANFKPTQTEMKCPAKYICNIETGATGKIPCVDLCMEEYAVLCNKAADGGETEPPVTAPPPTETSTPSTPPTEDTSTPTPATPTPTTPPTPTPTTPPTTTPAPPSTPNGVCEAKGTAGRYPYPNDTACRTYVYCFRQSGVWKGTHYQCPDSKYFNKRTTSCETAKPEGCV